MRGIIQPPEWLPHGGRVSTQLGAGLRRVQARVQTSSEGQPSTDRMGQSGHARTGRISLCHGTDRTGQSGHGTDRTGQSGHGTDRTARHGVARHRHRPAAAADASYWRTRPDRHPLLIRSAVSFLRPAGNFGVTQAPKSPLDGPDSRKKE